MIDEHVSESSATTDTLEAPRQCDWCASHDDLALLRDEWRCATCRGHEQVIAHARAFVEIHGLRPLGPSTASDDEEEEQLRIDARAARVALAESRVARPTVRTAKRSARPQAGRPAPRRSSRAATTVPDAARAVELLDRLSAIDSELAEIGEPASLPARARRSDLENRRATILRTLAALEKARRNN